MQIWMVAGVRNDNTGKDDNYDYDNNDNDNDGNDGDVGFMSVTDQHRR